MKKSARILALVLAVLMSVACIAFTGCSDKKGNDLDSGEEKKENTDLDYVKNKGKLVIGITEFAPMDYKEEGSDEWIGFDAEMAKAFAESIGVKAEFVVINWDKKILELNSKNIDCVWNGMTLDDAIKNAMETSNPYCTNMQVVVVPAAKADQYKTIDDVKGLKFAAEGGSAGEKVLTALNMDVTPVESQADALTNVKAGTSEAAVIDLLMAGAMIGEGTSYSDLALSVALNEDQKEQYGVGFRKDSPLAAELNEFMKKYYADGKMQTLAQKYGVQESLIEQK